MAAHTDSPAPNWSGRTVAWEAAPARTLLRPDELLVPRADLDAVRAVLRAIEERDGLCWAADEQAVGVDEPDTHRDRPVRFVLQQGKLSFARGSELVTDTVARLRDELGRRDVVFPNYVLCAPELDTATEFAPQPRYQGRIPPAPAEPPDGLPDPPDPGGPEAAVTVGVVDSGIDPQAPWLSGFRIDHAEEDRERPDDLEPKGELDPVAGHGTFIAGQILQAMPRARVACVRVFGPRGLVSDTDLVDGIDRLLARLEGRPLHVLNLSLAARTKDAEPPPALARKLRELRSDGVAIVAAAGNHGSDTPTWPAAAKDVFAVGALARDGTPAPYSDHGHWVDVLARGDARSSFFTFDTFRGWASWEGASFAAPRVSAAIAREAEKRGGSGLEAAFRLLERLRRRHLKAERLARQRFPVAEVL